MMQNVYNRVVNWNQKRYNREHNKELSLLLLREEYKEWLDAPNQVEKLDALCDITFVAMGAIWKLDVKPETHAFAAQQSQIVTKGLLSINEFWPGYLIATILDTYEYDGNYPAVHGYSHIISFALMQALSMGLSYDDFERAMLAVCDSNDSKSVKRTDSNIKANDGDKGLLYFAPTQQLEKILENVNEFS